MVKKCMYSLVSATIMVILCAILHTLLTLYTLLHKKATCHWTDTGESDMCSLCTRLCGHCGLALPDYTKPFQTEGNASDTAVGSVLTLEHISVHKTIAFLSEIFTSSEENFSVDDFKLLAIITYCKAWCKVQLGLLVVFRL